MTDEIYTLKTHKARTRLRIDALTAEKDAIYRELDALASELERINDSLLGAEIAEPLASTVKPSRIEIV